MGVGRGQFLLLVVWLQLSLWLGDAAFGWGSCNILDFNIGKKMDENLQGMSLKVYCESWRLNVELNNIRGFESVPGECVESVAKYVGSTQYQADVAQAADQAGFYLTEAFKLGGDGKDAWIFDVDDTLLSNFAYYKNINFGAVLGCTAIENDRTSLESWIKEENAPAIENMFNLFYEIRKRGIKIFIISARKEHLRGATVNNLVKAGYFGWSELILRCNEDGYDGVEKYKAEQRKKLINQGYRLWGVVGDQWSSLLGDSFAWRAFKLPNPMYYVA